MNDDFWSVSAVVQRASFFFEEIDSGNIMGCLADVDEVLVGAMPSEDLATVAWGGQGLVRSVAKTVPFEFADTLGWVEPV